MRNIRSNCTKMLVHQKRLILIAICCVLLCLVQETCQFTFNFGGGEDSEEALQSSSSTNTAKLAKKVRAVGKFKFRKIERVFTDEGNPEEDEANLSKDANVGDDELVNESKAQSDEADNSRMNEYEEATFEKARKAHKKLPQNKNINKKRKSKKYTDDDDDDEDERETTQSESSMFNAIYDKLFGAKQELSEQEDEDKNSIIAWLKWLGEKSGRSEEVSYKESDSSESWTNYLDRWPFNSLFPSKEKPKKKGSGAKKPSVEKLAHSEEVQPISQAEFETLLHTLPAFVLSTSNVDDIDCRRQLQIFQRQLRGNKMWTLEMLDASGKIASGVLHGNVNQFGDFEACTQVRTKVKITEEIPMSIRGKYCLAHIETQTSVKTLKVPLHLMHGRGLWNSHLGNPSHFVPRYTIANWGICLPQFCSADVVQQMLIENFRPYNSTGIQFQVEVNEDTDCYVQKSFKLFKQLRSDGKFLSTICLILSLCLLVLCSIVKENLTFIKELLAKIPIKRAKNTETAEEEKNETTEEKESTEKEAEIEENTETQTETDKEAENADGEAEKTLGNYDFQEF